MGSSPRVQGGDATAAVGSTWPLLTKCGLGETNGEPDSFGSSFPSLQPPTATVPDRCRFDLRMRKLPVLRAFSWFRGIRDLLTRLTGFRGDRLTRRADHGKSAF